MSVYAIRKGRKNNVIVHSWPECSKLVTGYEGAEYKKFPSEPAAKEYLSGFGLDESKPFNESNAIKIYTDGACSGNPNGPGGWGCIIIKGSNEFELSGGEKQTTNNQMELMACVEGLKYVVSRGLHSYPIIVYTDSKYLLNGMEKGWVENWENNAWRRADNQPVKNPELWKVLLELKRKINNNSNLIFRWVKGHNGDEYNERCDTLAVDASMQYKEYCGANNSQEADVLYYSTLIRDKVPDIIKEQGKVCIYEKLDTKEYAEKLKDKLIEECNEYIKDGTLEELVDIMEVIRAIANTKGISVTELEMIRQNKLNKKGGFQKRLLLKEVRTNNEA